MKRFNVRLWPGFKTTLILGLLLPVIISPAGEANGAPPLDPTGLVFVVGSTNGPPGTEVLVPVEVSGFADINTFQFSLHWSTANATFVDVEQLGLTGLAGANFGVTLTNNGTLTSSWDDLGGSGQSVPDGTILFEVRLLVVGAVGATSSLLINDTPTPVEVSIAPDGQVITPSLIPGQLTIISPNTAPVLAAMGDQTVDEGTLLSFTVIGTDADLPAQTLTYIMETGAPVGAAINSTNGLFTWTPTEAQGPGTYILEIRVTDSGLPALSNAKTFAITVNEVNTAPALAPIGDQTVNEGSLLSFTVTATDSDLPAQTLIYTLDAGAPSGAGINPTNGLFTWTPTEAQGPSTNLVTIRVTDNGSPAASVFETITVVVNEVNTAPVLAAIEDQVINEARLLTFTATATDAELPTQTLTYTLGAGAPVGAEIDPITGVFTWTPPKARDSTTNAITLIVSDNGLPSLSATQSFTVTVLKTNSAPVFMPLSGYLAQVLIPLRVTNVVSDPDLPPNRVTFEIVDAPKGTRINKYSGVVTWVPARSQARSTNWITVLATDDGTPPLSVTNTFQVKVDDYLELSLGRAVVLAGQSGILPITITNTSGVTNLSASLYVATDRLANLGITSLAPELNSGTLQPDGPGLSKMSFSTTAGQILQDGRLLAELNFTAISTQSAFVPLVISSLTASQSNGFPVIRTIANAGRVVVVGSEPLLEALPSISLQPVLVLYGLPGTSYVLESASNPLANSGWQTIWHGTLTSLSQMIQPEASPDRLMFFRAIRQK